MTRDQTMLVVVLIALYWLTRKQTERVPVPVITTDETYILPDESGQTIPGPGEPAPYDFDPDDYGYE